MNKSTIQTLIDKVIGKKGLIRVPSWWMRKVLMQIADWVQEGNDANGEKIVKVKEEADAKIITLDNSTKAALIELKKSLHTQKCFVVKTGANAGYVVVDGVTQEVPANTQKIVTYVNTFGFYNWSTTNSWLIFIGLTVADASSITDMSGMFYSCSSLTSLDLTGLDTSAVTNMASMFYYCSSLTSLDLTGLDTSAVTSMASMFFYCRGLTSLNLTGLDTSAVTSMASMFQWCSSLTSLDLSGFDTSAVTSMSSMFAYCRGLTSLNLSGFDTSAVTNMASMFQACSGLTSLILGPNFFKSSKVTDISFSDCTKWTNDTVVTSLVTNSYDRATAGLKTMTLKLSTNTKAALTDEQKAAIMAKGYTIA